MSRGRPEAPRRRRKRPETAGRLTIRMSDDQIVTPAPAEPGRDAPRPPAWLQLPPFTPRQWRVFGISTTAGFFDQYDGALLSLALKQIQRGLNIAEGQLGAMLSVIRLGYLLSLLISPLADIFGRRSLLMYTIIGYTLFTGASALAPSRRGFVASQFLARGFSGAEATVSLVILAEEVDAAVRGWAIGLQGALALSGYGLAAIVFSLIAIIPYGWRGLYALALLPLGLIVPLRRMLPESRRFESETAARAERRRLLEPIVALVRISPGRVAMIVAVAFLNAMGWSPASLFFPKYLQDAHHWSPGQVSSLIVFGGAIGILGSIVAGRLSDRYGRRTMGALFLLIGPILAIWMYATRNDAVIGIWIVRLFFDTAGATILVAYSAELFPTSHRSAAASATTVAGTTGAALGLLLEGYLYAANGSHWRSIQLLMGFSIAAAILMYLTFPETAGRELEEIAREQGGAARRTAIS
jgi:putative MFS transporter